MTRTKPLPPILVAILIMPALTGCWSREATQPSPTLSQHPVETPVQPTAVSGVSAASPPETLPAVIPSPTFPVITSNSQWSPVIQPFGGLEMALVPAGCFMMGSTSGDDDEQPLSQQCFSKPFWIDRTEITNGQYGTPGSFAGPDRPRDTVNLPEAMAFCESRHARLPTESEWEYAARGPDSLIFPWGNTFIADNVVYIGNSHGASADVGSRPGGASWVGALDMSGNLWEWTSSIYDPQRFPYPYLPDDGRENPGDTVSPRAIRGGSWSNEEWFTRTTNRKSKHPTLEWYGYMGFRCARDS